MKNFPSLWKGLRVLMYHSVAFTPADALTVNPCDFEKQIVAFKKAGFEFLALPEVLDKNFRLKERSKALVFTFDDGYLDQYEYAYPILQAYNVPATFFLTTSFIGDKSRWDGEKARALMCTQLLNSLNKNLITFGLHTHAHINLEQYSLEEIQDDLNKNIQFMKQFQLYFLPTLAYPYGKRPKDPSVKKQLFDYMSDIGIHYGFRIGNRINKEIDKNPYEIQRIDIRGTDSHKDVMTKVQYGKILF